MTSQWGRRSAGLAVCCLLVSACTAQARPPQNTPSPTWSAGASAGPTPGTTQTARFGTSLSPRSTTEDDFTTFLELVDDAGGILLWAGDWSELATEDGAPEITVQLASDRGLTPVLATGLPRTSNEEHDLDADQRERVVAVYRDFVAEHRVPWLAVGVEVDELERTSPQLFDEYVAAFADIAIAVSDASPATKVFPVFQFERVAGRHGGLFGGADGAPPRWDLLTRFPDADAIGFTTYPALVFGDPAEIPDDYYEAVADHTDLPVLFTEVGWFAGTDIAGWESSEAEQLAFVERLAGLMDALDPEAVIWSFLFDQDVEVPFDTMGLLDDTGQERLAWRAWTELAS